MKELSFKSVFELTGEAHFEENHSVQKIDRNEKRRVDSTSYINVTRFLSCDYFFSFLFSFHPYIDTFDDTASLDE
jgi:hypothetical protein